MSKTSIRSGTKTPFKPNVDMGTVKIKTTNRYEIYKKMVEYERKLRIIAFRFKYNSISELPKQIYKSRVINALKKLRDNSSASTMGSPLGGAITGAGDLGVPLLDAVPTTQIDALQGISQATAENYVSDIDDSEADIEEVNNTAVASDEQRSDLPKILAKEITIDPASESAPSSSSSSSSSSSPAQRGESKVSDEDIDTIFTGIRLDKPTQYEKDELRRLLEEEGEVYDDADAVRDKANQIAKAIAAKRPPTTTTTKLKELDISKIVNNDTFIKYIFNGIGVSDFTAMDMLNLRTDIIAAKPYDSDEDLVLRAKELANKIISKRQKNPTTTQLGKGEEIEKYLINVEGEISGRGIDGALMLLLMDGSWVPVNFAINELNPRYQVPIDAHLYWIIPISMPAGMSPAQWNAITQKMTRQNAERKIRQPKNPPIGIPRTDPKQPDSKQPDPKQPDPKAPETPDKKKDEDDPPVPYEPPEDPRKDRRKTIQIPQSSVAPLPANRTLGIASLRPFFSTYHGLDLLIETDKEAIEDIKQYDLFDLPIPENDNMDNPLFVHNMKAQMARFTDDANPFQYATVKNTITSEILATNFAGSLTQEMILSNVPFIDNGVATQNCIDIENINFIPTVLGGLKDGVPFRNPNINNYQRGFGQADRTAAGYTQSIIQSLYANPEIYNSLITISNPFK